MARRESGDVEQPVNEVEQTLLVSFYGIEVLLKRGIVYGKARGVVGGSANHGERSAELVGNVGKEVSAAAFRPAQYIVALLAQAGELYQQQDGNSGKQQYCRGCPDNGAFHPLLIRQRFLQQSVTVFQRLVSVLGVIFAHSLLHLLVVD